MCLIHLDNKKVEFKNFSRVSIGFKSIDVYDFNSNIILSLPRGDKEKKEFELLSLFILNTLDDSIELPGSKKPKLLDRLAWSTFYDPNLFFDDLEDNHLDKDDSLSCISMLEKLGVNTFNMASVANRYWEKNI